MFLLGSACRGAAREEVVFEVLRYCRQFRLIVVSAPLKQCALRTSSNDDACCKHRRQRTQPTTEPLAMIPSIPPAVIPPVSHRTVP